MPFNNYKEYERTCSRMSKVELRNEIKRQSDTITGAGAGTGLAILAIPLTMGVSALAVGATGPAIVHAKKKRAIARKYLALPGPEVGPNFSTMPAPLQSSNTRSSTSTQKSKSQEEDLPVYMEYDREHTVADTREKQANIPVEHVALDLPPSYDDATIRRMSSIHNHASSSRSSIPGHPDSEARGEQPTVSQIPSRVESEVLQRPGSPSSMYSQPGLENATQESTNDPKQKSKARVRFNALSSSS